MTSLSLIAKKSGGGGTLSVRRSARQWVLEDGCQQCQRHNNIPDKISLYAWREAQIHVHVHQVCYYVIITTHARAIQDLGLAAV